eukprot:3742959-Prymnesium_polylepis.1
MLGRRVALARSGLAARGTLACALRIGGTGSPHPSVIHRRHSTDAAAARAQPVRTAPEPGES